jgi:hypothetical protein
LATLGLETLAFRFQFGLAEPTLLLFPLLPLLLSPFLLLLFSTDCLLPGPVTGVLMPAVTGLLLGLAVFEERGTKGPDTLEFAWDTVVARRGGGLFAVVGTVPAGLLRMSAGLKVGLSHGPGPPPTYFLLRVLVLRLVSSVLRLAGVVRTLGVWSLLTGRCLNGRLRQCRRSGAGGGVWRLCGNGVGDGLNMPLGNRSNAEGASAKGQGPLRQ